MEIKKILIVDDEEVIRKLFTRLLGETYNVTTAESGREALEKISQEKFDVVFIDMVMPEMDGLETLKAIKKISPELNCVVMTGFAVEEKIKEALQTNAIDYLYKPFAMEEIHVIFSKLEKREKLKPIK